VGTMQKLKGGYLLVFAAKTERWGTLQILKGGYLLVFAAKTERWVPA
jgi:hypothetical protein